MASLADMYATQPPPSPGPRPPTPGDNNLQTTMDFINWNKANQAYQSYYQQHPATFDPSAPWDYAAKMGTEGRDTSSIAAMQNPAFRSFIMPPASDGADNKYAVLDWLYNPANQVRDAQGNLLQGGANAQSWGSKFYVPGSEYSSMVQPYDTNPKSDGILGSIDSWAPLLIGGLGAAGAAGLFGGGGVLSGGAGALPAVGAGAGAGGSPIVIADALSGGLTPIGGPLTATGAGGAAAGSFGSGVFNGASNFLQSPISSISNLFSGGGSPGGAMSTAQLNQAAQAYAAAGYSPEQITGFLSQASGASAADVTAALNGTTSALNFAGGTGSMNGIGGLLSGLGNSSTLATLAGAALGGINGSKQTGTQTTTQDPWAGQQPYLLDMFNKAKLAADSNAQSPYQTSALSTMQQFANGPTTNPYAGVDNPYLTSTINNASADAMRNMMPAFDQAQKASGSFGNSGQAETFARTAGNTLGNIATNARMQDYQTQQQLGENAVNRTASILPTMYTAGQTSASNPWTNIKNYSNAVTGNYGGTTSQPIYTNSTANMLGGGLLGSQLYKSLLG